MWATLYIYLNLTLYKAFVHPKLVYGDILYNNCIVIIAHNASSHEKLESIQYNACLIIIETTRGSSREKLYQKLLLTNLALEIK